MLLSDTTRLRLRQVGQGAGELQWGELESLSHMAKSSIQMDISSQLLHFLPAAPSRRTARGSASSACEKSGEWLWAQESLSHMAKSSIQMDICSCKGVLQAALARRAVRGFGTGILEPHGKELHPDGHLLVQRGSASSAGEKSGEWLWHGDP